MNTRERTVHSPRRRGESTGAEVVESSGALYAGDIAMTDRPFAPAALLGLLLAAGIALAGYWIGDGLLQARATDRFVTVKGLSERELPANLVLWPIVFNVTADDLIDLQQRVDENVVRVRDFLAADFDEAEIGVSTARITDRQAQGGYPQGRPLDRYVAECTVTVRTAKIDAARDAMTRSGELVKQGVALIRSYEYQTRFLFTGLDAIKPEMIAEATRDARRAAQQFAEDSGSRVGAIRKARQGYFSVEDRDPFSPEQKTIRVVTTIEYFLVDD
jgi:hypothetical protein